MSSYVLGFQNIDKTAFMVVGGKGAHLGELSRIDGIHVPEGFCISTRAFQRIVEEIPSMNELLEQLSLLRLEDREKIGELSSAIRRVIEENGVPEDMQEEIVYVLHRLGEHHAYAVRSSATAEDLPTASFAGQQDTYLNIIGAESILRHISKCWASLFTERAVLYRIQNGFDHRTVYLAVVVQKMVFPQAAGIVFTADPVTSNRKVVSIDAGFGLGEALVSGLVNADSYKVRDGRIIEKKVSSKHVAVYALKGGGTTAQELEPGHQTRQVLTEEQIVQLERIGRTIEEHFGCPQDIEWCLVEDTFFIVQSRPITTLYPIPDAPDRERHVYVSVGHQQMMTDPIKPLGLSLFRLTAGRPMYTAGGRLFVDVAGNLASPAGRDMIINGLGKSDPLIKDALMTIVQREEAVPLVPDDRPEQQAGTGRSSMPPAQAPTQADYDPALIAGLIDSSRKSLEELQQTIRAISGEKVFDCILEDIGQLKKNLFDPQALGVIMAAMNAWAWLNEKMEEWLGEKNAADVLSQSVPNNITSEMGLALLDVADVIRPYPEVIEYLHRVNEENVLEDLPRFHGGRETLEALSAYLTRYGMRCVGEIDITKTRWSEKPEILIPMILSNIKNFGPGAGARKFEQGRREALRKEQELLQRLKQQPDGEHRAEETQRMIGLLRNFIGYREYPKYGMVNRYFVYKQALLREAEQLVQAGVMHQKDDAYYLTFEEFREAVRTQTLDYQVIDRRKDEYRVYEKLTPPRVMTSDGEIIAGAYKRENLPVGALVGLPVSSGVVEGRARVLLTIEEANLEEGDILVTSFTDPSWTPLFVAIKGLVTEVGGLMTHGAVIAREYGLPAVVGVEHATTLINDGQRIRVHGTEGYVELL